LIPDFAATANPFDTTAFPSDDVLTDVLAALAEDEAYAAVVMLVATTTGETTARRPAAVAAAAERSDTPVAAVWLSSWLDGPGSEILDASTGVPVFRSSDTCFRALRAWMDWHTSLGSDPTPLAEIPVAAGLGQVGARFAALPPGLLDEARSRDLMEACGIRVPRGYVAASAEATVAAAEKIGWPVAVKILSAEIAHKAAAGGVELGVGDEPAAEAAYQRIVASVRAHRDADVSEVLVAEMVDAVSGEFMCGLTRDPVFGPVVVVGAGGGAVEQTRDVARCTLPLTETKARDAVRRLRAHGLLAARDPQASTRLVNGLVLVMGTLAALAAAAPNVAEVDLNPVVLAGDGDVVALDALVVLR
jgi:acyl-CoA synthetase (NDP forming)